MKRTKQRNSKAKSIKPKRKGPGYRLHKPTGQGFVELGGKRHYCGRYDLPESEAKALRLITAWISNGKRLEEREVAEIKAAKVDASDALTVEEIAAAFWTDAERRYVRPDGAPKMELTHYKSVLGIVRKLYGPTVALNFGPNALRLCREKMIERDWSRPYINHQVGRIKRVWRWAVAHEMLPAPNASALDAVEGLRYATRGVRDGRKVRAVPLPYVEAIKPFVSRQVWALIQLQLSTGARAGELVTMRLRDVNVSGKVWEYRPVEHKGAHRGHERIIYIGPRGQRVIEEFMPRQPGEFLFSPVEADAERRERLHAERKTPLSCGNRPGTNRLQNPTKKPGAAYTTASYRQAIEYGIAAANRAKAEETAKDKKNREVIPHWTPHQLRHSAATELRREFGIETARIILGHKSAGITEVYAEADAGRAKDVIARVG